MTLAEIAAGKWHAARTLWRMCRYLRNWNPVWQAYRVGRTIPDLQFRRGITLSSGRMDDPVLMLQEVYCDKIYHRHLKSSPEGVVVDIGANIGAVALDFADRWPNLVIHAYEPNPDTFEALKRNIADNRLTDRVALFNEAVADKRGEFHLWTNLLSVGASGYLDSPPDGATLLSVPCSTLSTVFKRIAGESIFLLKVDVEGAERDIFENAEGVPFDKVRNIAVECHEKQRPGAKAACIRILQQHGFRYTIDAVQEAAGVYMLYGWRE